ncbi:MAG: cyclic nucleotide-binding domain-containing protein [Myxococcota bacterium]
MRSFFPSSPPERVVRQMQACLTSTWYDAGEVLFRAGEPANQAFFIVEGCVEMSTEGEEPWLFTDGSVVGILDANLARPRVREARVIEPTHCLVLDIMDYFDILEDNFDFAETLMRRVFGMVHNMALNLPPKEVHPRRHGAPQQPWLSVRRLNEIQKLMILRSSVIGKHSPIQPLVNLARLTQEQRLSKDRVLLEKDQPLDHLMIVAEGLLRAESEDVPKVDAAFDPGSVVLGSTAFVLDHAPMPVIASRPSLVLSIRIEALWDTMEDHFELFRSVFAYLASEHERVRNRLSQLNPNTRDLAKAFGGDR